MAATIPHAAARASILKCRFHHGLSLPSESSQHLNNQVQFPLHSYGGMHELDSSFQPLATSSLSLYDLPCGTSFSSLNLFSPPPPARHPQSLYTWFHLFWNVVFLLPAIYLSTNNSGLNFNSLSQDDPWSLVVLHIIHSHVFLHYALVILNNKGNNTEHLYPASRVPDSSLEFLIVTRSFNL